MDIGPKGVWRGGLEKFVGEGRKGLGADLSDPAIGTDGNSSSKDSPSFSSVGRCFLLLPNRVRKQRSQQRLESRK